ncbi:MAG: AarF/ABC1/UbiB kinase family protein [Chitinophagales bacterium]
MFFNQTFKNIGRTREIIGVLVKYGFEDAITNTTLRNFITERKRLTWMRQNKPVFEYSRWERIRMVVEELGPTFVKLAQILSNRPDMLPQPLIDQLEKLQDHVPPFPIEEVRAIIKKELGKDLEHFFNDFNPVPLASASIGQVHKAQLKDGSEVVVKIQRPGVKDIIELDLGIMKDVVNRTERYLKKQGIINAGDVVSALERSMGKELDYRNESRNITRFRKLYGDYKNFYIPRSYKDLTSEKVMVIEFASGCKISDVRQLRAWGHDPRKVAENGMDIYLTQIFEYGIFHADPHPGNVLVRKDGVICLIDFGMVGQLNQNDKIAFANIFVAMANRDPRSMASSMKKLSIEDDITDMRAFEYDLNEIIEDYASLDISESSLADMIARLQKIMYDYQMRVPGGIFLIFRAMAILEGIGKQIHPNFNTYDFVKPYGVKLIKQQLMPKNIYNELSHRFNQFSALFGSIPVEIKSILQKTRKGKLHIEVELQGYGYLLKKMDSITNRISITLIIVALIIGSSIVTTADFSKELRIWYGMPMISVMGLSAAGFLFLILAYSIIRRRKYK